MGPQQFGQSIIRSSHRLASARLKLGHPVKVTCLPGLPVIDRRKLTIAFLPLHAARPRDVRAKSTAQTSTATAATFRGTGRDVAPRSPTSASETFGQMRSQALSQRLTTTGILRAMVAEDGHIEVLRGPTGEFISVCRPDGRQCSRAFCAATDSTTFWKLVSQCRTASRTTAGSLFQIDPGRKGSRVSR